MTGIHVKKGKHQDSIMKMMIRNFELFLMCMYDVVNILYRSIDMADNVKNDADEAVKSRAIHESHKICA